MAVACPSCGEANPARARFCLSCGAAVSAEGAGERAHETRRSVTVLFTDVVGSTPLGEKLDPESLREVMERYFDAMRVAVEGHGGTVEKFIGDAVMAVFGIPQLHEDDALRAVRAAFDMRAALAVLNRDLSARWGIRLAIRTGINTGEVVAGDAASGQQLATGDVVNTAARLEQQAESGQILIGTQTYRLVRHAVRAKPGSALQLKGKAKAVPAWRVTSIDPNVGALERPADTPFVGRQRELGILTEAAVRAREDRAPQLVTILGLAGVGKTRLVHEFLGRVSSEATVIRGHCLSSGDAITYGPLAEALRPIAGIEPDATAEHAIDRLILLAGNLPHAQQIAERVAGAIGLSMANAGSAGQETFWAIRRLLEAMARNRPLVVVFDDVQWATPTFLDLIEHIADWARDAAILLVVIGRTELMETRSTWGGGKFNSTTVLLEPLDEAAVDQMLADLFGRQLLPELGRKLKAAAEGNPFVVEEAIAMLVDEGFVKRDGALYRVTAIPPKIPMPATVELLLAARLDHLPDEERAVLGRASVAGRWFGASEVAQLAPNGERASTLPGLMSLVRKELIRLDDEENQKLDDRDEDVRFRFRHQLLRDAAYESLPKHERARLHAALADWMESALASRVDVLHEIVGYHLEQASRYLRSLGGASGEAERLARRAVEHLSAASVKAEAIGDNGAVARLLERAADLLPNGDRRRLALLPRMAEALTEVGRLEDAEAAVNEVLESTAAEPATRAEALELVELQARRGQAAAAVEPMVEEALRIRRQLGDPDGIARALCARAAVTGIRGALTEAGKLLEEALALADAAGDARLQAKIRYTIIQIRFLSLHGAASDLSAGAAELLEFAGAHGNLTMAAMAKPVLALATACQGDHDGAVALAREAEADAAELGIPLSPAVGPYQAYIEEWFGNTEEAIALTERNIAQLQEIGERGYLSTEASGLARLLLDAERVDEAAEALRLAQETGAADDAWTQIEILADRARLAARKGDLPTAKKLAKRAIREADRTELMSMFVVSRLALADVLRLAGQRDQPRHLIEEAAAEVEERGNVAYAATIRRRGEGLGAR
jgi:class 3 adenylate cyclase